MIQFERSWPEGFYTLLSKEVVTFNTKKKRLAVGEHAVVDQEAIYARVIGLLVSARHRTNCLSPSNKCLIPRNMAEGAPYASKQILKLVKCGCVSERPCKEANCGCMGHQLPCTMFCACGGRRRACLNASNIQDTDEAVNQDVDTDDCDKVVEDDSNDDEDNL